jgi:hypothetical protein
MLLVSFMTVTKLALCCAAPPASPPPPLLLPLLLLLHQAWYCNVDCQKAGITNTATAAAAAAAAAGAAAAAAAANRQAWYCNVDYQKAAWRSHKHTCKQRRLAVALHQAEQQLRQEPEQQQQESTAAGAAAVGDDSSFSAYPSPQELAAAVLRDQQVGWGALLFFKE